MHRVPPPLPRADVLNFSHCSAGLILEAAEKRGVFCVKWIIFVVQIQTEAATIISCTNVTVYSRRIQVFSNLNFHRLEFHTLIQSGSEP